MIDSIEACGSLCKCVAAGRCKTLTPAESDLRRVENARHWLGRFRAEGRTMNDGREVTLEDLLPDVDPLAAAIQAHNRRWNR
jgi:hypothetical protein